MFRGMANIREIIGDNLAHLRKDAKLTQLELAEKFNYSDKAVSKWEKGDTIPDIETLYDLCEFYGVTIDYLTHEGNASEKKEFLRDTKSDFQNKILITALLITIFWMIATIVFVYTFIKLGEGYWQAYLWAVPASCILAIVADKKFFRSSLLNLIVESTLIWSFLAALYCTICTWTLWPIFLLGIPLQMALGIWFVMNNQRK